MEKLLFENDNLDIFSTLSGNLKVKDYINCKTYFIKATAEYNAETDWEGDENEVITPLLAFINDFKAGYLKVFRTIDFK